MLAGFLVVTPYSNVLPWSPAPLTCSPWTLHLTCVPFGPSVDPLHLTCTTPGPSSPHIHSPWTLTYADPEAWTRCTSHVPPHNPLPIPCTIYMVPLNSLHLTWTAPRSPAPQMQCPWTVTDPLHCIDALPQDRLDGWTACIPPLLPPDSLLHPSNAPGPRIATPIANAFADYVVTPAPLVPMFMHSDGHFSAQHNPRLGP